MTQPAPRFFRGAAVTSAALAVCATLHTAAAAGAEPVAVFVGDGLEVVIETAGPGGRELRGRLHHLGQQYPFTATTREDFGRSEGTFGVGNDRFAFSLLPTGDADTLRLVTPDARGTKEVVYDLQRRAPRTDAGPRATADAEVSAPDPGGAPAAAAASTATPASPAPATAAAPAPVGLSLRGLFGGGWEVTAVDPGSRAEQAGFAPGDVITAAREAGGADLPLPDRAAVVAALRRPGVYLTAARAGRADHTVVLYPASPKSPSAAAAAPHIAKPAQPAEPAAVAKPGSSAKPAASETKRSAPAAASPTPAAVASSAAPAVAAPRAAAPAPAGTAEPVPAPTAVLTLQSVAIPDPAVTGLSSHDLLLPQGWSLDAEVLWTPAVDAAFVNVNARATSPGGGHQVTWLPDGAFTDAVDAGTAYGAVSDGKVHFPRFVNAAAFVTDAVLPGFRPDVTGVRVLSADESPGLSDAWERHHETFLNAQKKHASALHARRAGGSATAPTTAVVTAPRVRLRYEENGAAYEEEFTFVHLLLTTAAGDTPAHDWFVFAVSALRGPAGGLDDATPGLRAVAESLRPTQRWQALIEAMTPELTRAQPPLDPARAAALAAPLLGDLDALVTAHTRGWSALRAANAARVEAFAAAGPGLAVAQTADGTTKRLLPTGPGLRAVANPRGAVVLTQDPPAADAARPDGPWTAFE